MHKDDASQPFDCLAFKDRVQTEISSETQGMSHREELEYLRRHANEGPFADWWRRIKQKRDIPTA